MNQKPKREPLAMVWRDHDPDREHLNVSLPLFIKDTRVRDIDYFLTEEAANAECEKINRIAESFAQRRVDEAVKPLVKLLMAAYSVIPYSAILLETGCPLNDEIKKALEEPK